MDADHERHLSMASVLKMYVLLLDASDLEEALVLIVFWSLNLVKGIYNHRPGCHETYSWLFLALQSLLLTRKIAK